jgi:hypothetical protein
MRESLGLPRELWIEIFGKSWSRAIERKEPCLYVYTDGSRRACAVGDCPRLVTTLGALGETSGPRIDRIPLTRPSWWRRQYRELKNLFFLAPDKCPIDLFGPIANGTVLKQLRVVFALLVSYKVASSNRRASRQPHKLCGTDCCLFFSENTSSKSPSTPAPPAVK